MRPDHQPPMAFQPRGGQREEGRYIWQSVEAVERIMREAGTRAPSCLAVYVALSRIASWNGNKPTFDEPIQKIAGLAGLRYRTTWEVLWFLDDIGLVAIRENIQGKQNLNHTITILSTRMHLKQEGLCNKDRRGYANSDKRNLQTVIKRNGKETPSAFGGGQKPPADAAGENKKGKENTW